MASDLVLNGVTFNGTPASNPTNPRKPNGYSYKEKKAGTVLVSASEKRTMITRLDGSSNPIYKGVWEVTWERTTETTRAALRTIARLTTTWTFVDLLGVSHTVECEDGDYEEEVAATDVANVTYWKVKLTIREV